MDWVIYEISHTSQVTPAITPGLVVWLLKLGHLSALYTLTVTGLTLQSNFKKRVITTMLLYQGLETHVVQWYLQPD